jgi:NAD(P)-dependent dehydrogenase (short-subunit alcohol dehydrogenase family)
MRDNEPTNSHTRGTAVVTGGARGLGQAFSLALARAHHDIAIIDLDDPSETISMAQECGVRALSLIGDAADPDTVQEFERTVKDSDLSPVRILLNNVGISPYAPFLETDLQMWRRVLRTNLDSMFLFTKAFLPDIQAHGSGRIVNLTSSIVWDAQVRDMSAYATTKAGVVGFTRALAGECGVSGATVNAIAPGIVLTPDIKSRVPEEKLEVYRQRQAVHRLAEPEDLISTLLYIVDEASGLVTGTIFPVNGGRVFL